MFLTCPTFKYFFHGEWSATWHPREMVWYNLTTLRVHISSVLSKTQHVQLFRHGPVNSNTSSSNIRLFGEFHAIINVHSSFDTCFVLFSVCMVEPSISESFWMDIWRHGGARNVFYAWRRSKSHSTSKKTAGSGVFTVIFWMQPTLLYTQRPSTQVLSQSCTSYGK